MYQCSDVNHRSTLTGRRGVDCENASFMVKYKCLLPLPIQKLALPSTLQLIPICADRHAIARSMIHSNVFDNVKSLRRPTKPPTKGIAGGLDGDLSGRPPRNADI
jgi:hypothetical protein